MNALVLLAVVALSRPDAAQAVLGREEADLRLLGRVSAVATAAGDGSVATVLRCGTDEAARRTASKFLTDIRSFGDDAGLFAVGHRGTEAAVVFSAKGAPALPDGFVPSRTNDYPLWFDRFDNRPIALGQGGWGTVSPDYRAGMVWTARQGFSFICPNYVTYDSWAAPGVWNHALNDAFAAEARRLGVGYLDYPLMAHPENPAWYWNEVPLPYARGKDGAVGPTSFSYFKYAAHGSDWPMPAIEPLIAYCNQECARHYGRDDHFIAHFGTPEMAGGQAAMLPGYAGEEDVVTMREIVGYRPGVSLDLRGEWTMRDGTNAPVRIDCGDPVLLAWARHPDGFSLTRTFAVSGDLARHRFLHVANGNWHGRLSAFGEVTVNGRAAKDLTVRHPLTGDLESCYDLDGLLRPGENEITVRGVKCPLGYYAFLGAEGRFAYPSADEGRNRMFFDLAENAARRVLGYAERRLRAHCAGDAAGRPQFAMCHTMIGDLGFDVLHRYAGYQHDTGQTQGCWAPWCSRYWKTRGDPVSCEDGGPPKDADGLRWMMTRYLMLGNDAVNLLFDPRHFWGGGQREWIEGHGAWLGCLAKNDRERFDLCVLRSIRNAARLRDPTPWRLDPSRGALQAAGRVPGLVDPCDLVNGRARAWADVLMDAGTTILTDGEAKALARFIREGGTFIANEATGRHSHLRRDAWPLFAELGLPAEAILYGGKKPVNFREFRIGKGRLVLLSSLSWRMSDDGRKFNFDDPGQIPALGAFLDRLGVPRSSGGAHLPGMRDCFAETWRSKNGLYDLFILALMGGTNAVAASPVFCAPGKVGKLVELSAEGHPPQAFEQDAENRLRLKDVPLLPGESRVYAALREDAGLAPLYWLKALERRWYRLGPVPEVGKPSVAARAERRFLPLSDGWTHLESGRRVKLGTYVTMGIADDCEKATFARTFTVPSAWKGRRVSLAFESQGYIYGFFPRAKVSLNGVELPRKGNLGFRTAIADSGEMNLKVEIDGALPANAKRCCPSGFCGVVYLEASDFPKRSIRLNGFTHGLAGAVETAFPTPAADRVRLASDGRLGTFLLNDVMLEVPPVMREVDVTGILRRDGRPNRLRWWPAARELKWDTPHPSQIPELALELHDAP